MTDDSKAIRQARRAQAVQSWFAQSELAMSMPRHAPEIVGRICQYVAETGESPRSICQNKSVPEAPAYSTFLFWMQSDPAIEAMVRAARVAAAAAAWEGIEKDITDVIDDAVRTGSKVELQAAQTKAKLMVEIRMFQVKKMLPAVYGDRPSKSDADTDGDASGVRVVEIKIPPKEE